MRKIFLVILTVSLVLSCISKTSEPSYEQQLFTNMEKIKEWRTSFAEIYINLYETLPLAENFAEQYKTDFFTTSVTTDYLNQALPMLTAITKDMTTADDFISLYDTRLKDGKENYPAYIKNLLQKTTDFLRNMDKWENITADYNDKFTNMTTLMYKYNFTPDSNYH